jgi:uncharacterized membrane protein HdeD (DUF308 family)
MITDTRADGTGNAMAGIVPDGPISGLLAQNWWVIALRGAFSIVFGIIALLLPGVTLAALVLLFAAYMLVDGVCAIVVAFKAARRRERWGWLVLEGVADLVAGAIALIWPIATVIAFVLLMGAWAIVSGMLLIAAASRLTHGSWLLLLAGAASLIWGVLLVVWPLPGAVVLVWWMAAYALIFGGALLALAFRLRRRRQIPISGMASQSV